MEKKGARTVLLILRILAVIILIALGLFFTLETYLCLNVDGVHILGYTIMPALALLCYTLAWLLARKKRKPAAQSADDERALNPPDDGATL